MMKEKNLKLKEMGIKNIIDAVKNIDKIYEGTFNSIFKKEHVEIMATTRMNICNSCELIDNQGDKCFMPGTQPCCSDCGCSLKFKVRSPSSSCPKGKWLALLTEEEEEQLNN